MGLIAEVFNHTLIITGFVFVMMLVIEYVNVLSQGAWQKRLASSHFGQYLFAALMGIIPGCLGAFVIVTMYAHRMVTVGAVVTVMIATSGDEAFVMLSMIPREAFLLMAVLFVLGLGSGILTDFILKRNKKFPSSLFYNGVYTGEEQCKELQVHTTEHCRCLPGRETITRWKAASAARMILTVVLGLFIVFISTGKTGPEEWNGIRISILFIAAMALFIVITVPEHFLKDHLWDHVALKHVPRIFAWTFGALILMHVLIEYLHLEELIQQNLWAVLGGASLLGLIPESGPHLIFVTLFDSGTVPFSILLASSIVQDGHGMLPLLAHSRRAFIFVKCVNLLVGLLAGGIILTLTEAL